MLNWISKYFIYKFKKSFPWSSLVAQRLKIWHCHCSGMSFIPGLGTSACHVCGQEKKEICSMSNLKYFHLKMKGMVEQKISEIFFFFFFFFGCACDMWKFLGKRLNWRHSSKPSHCSDNARSLTCCTTQNTQVEFLYLNSGSPFTCSVQLKLVSLISLSISLKFCIIIHTSQG